MLLLKIITIKVVHPHVNYLKNEFSYILKNFSTSISVFKKKKHTIIANNQKPLWKL